jgi:hypothetical protein
MMMHTLLIVYAVGAVAAMLIFCVLLGYMHGDVESKGDLAGDVLGAVVFSAVWPASLAVLAGIFVRNFRLGKAAAREGKR